MNTQQTIRILIAEDDFLVSERIREVIETIGHIIVGEAVNGRQAVEMTIALRPDVVLMDIKMPDIDGLEAAQLIQEQCPTPIVVMTAYQSAELVAKASAAGVGAYILKPPDASQLKRVLIVARDRFNDMMALRESNRRLEKTLADLETAQAQIIEQERLAAVGQLASGIAHEYNNALAVIMLYTDLILRTDTVSPKTEKRLEIIRQKGDYAAHLTQQIVDFGQTSMLQRQQIDLSLFMQEMVALLNNLLPQKINIVLDSQVRAIIVKADPARLKQAIMNLVLNAQNAMPNGGHLRLFLHHFPLTAAQTPPVPEMKVGEWAAITVEDNGNGIAPKVLPRIFEPFFSTKTPERSGLGLSQFFGIVKQHGGEVNVESKVGKGTAVTLYLPALQIAPQSESEDKADPILAMGNGETILVVEDDPIMQMVLKDSLEMLNYQVLVTNSSREALRIIEQYSDQLTMIATDYNIQANNLKLCYAIKQQYPNLHCLVFSNYALDTQEENLKAAGFKHWLRKPISLHKLAATISNMVS